MLIFASRSADLCLLYHFSGGESSVLFSGGVLGFDPYINIVGQNFFIEHNIIGAFIVKLAEGYAVLRAYGRNYLITYREEVFIE